MSDHSKLTKGERAMLQRLANGEKLERMRFSGSWRWVGCKEWVTRTANMLYDARLIQYSSERTRYGDSVYTISEKGCMVLAPESATETGVV